METKLFGCSKIPARVVADFNKPILQAVLQEYADKNLESGLIRIFKITTGIPSIAENRKTRVHISSFRFLKMKREFIKKLYGKKDDTGKANFCPKIISRLIYCQSVGEAMELCKLSTVVMKNKKVATAVEKVVQELEKTINCFDLLPQIEKNTGCFTIDEDDQEVIFEAASPQKDLWDKELANYITKKERNNKLWDEDKQNKYFMDSYCH